MIDLHKPAPTIDDIVKALVYEAQFEGGQRPALLQLLASNIQMDYTLFVANGRIDIYHRLGRSLKRAKELLACTEIAIKMGGPRLVIDNTKTAREQQDFQDFPADRAG